jgi:hypothetical protein
LPPFNNRHHSLAPEAFTQNNQNQLINLNNAKMPADRSIMKLKKGPKSMRSSGTPDRSGDQSIQHTNNNFLKDPVFEFDDDI